MTIISLLHGRNCLLASILQIAIVASCLLIEVKSKTRPARGQNCTGGRIELKCRQNNAVIEIKSATLGYTSNSCCECSLKNQRCTKKASEDHLTSMTNKCNGLQSCSVTAETRWIFCNWFWRSTTSEHISFKCKYKRATSQKPFVTNSSAHNETSTEGQDDECSELVPNSTHDSHSTCDKDASDEDEENPSEENDEIKLIVIIVFVCLGINLVVIIVVIFCRRKKQQAVKSLPKIETPQYNAEYEEICINSNEDGVYHCLSTEESANPTQSKPMIMCTMVNHPKDSMTDSFEDRIYHELEVKEPNTEPYKTDIYEMVCEVNGNLDGAVQQKKSEATSKGHSADSNPDINKQKRIKNVPKFPQEVIASDGILHTTANEDSGLENAKQNFTYGNELVDLAALGGDLTELTVVENDLYSM